MIDITFWIWLLISGIILLFAFKAAYVLSVTLALPKTQGALYVSTARKKIITFMKAVPMKPGQIFVDLGCGDGRVLRMVHKYYGVRAIGYEINPLAYLKARLQCLGRKGIEIRYQSFWKVNLSEADVVYCYLFPDILKPLSIKLFSDLKNRAIVVSANFPLPGLQTKQIINPLHGPANDPLYLYQIKK